MIASKSCVHRIGLLGWARGKGPGGKGKTHLLEGAQAAVRGRVRSHRLQMLCAARLSVAPSREGLADGVTPVPASSINLQHALNHERHEGLVRYTQQCDRAGLS